MLVRVLNFDEEAIGSVAKSRYGSVNDRETLAQFVRAMVEIAGGNEFQGCSGKRGGHEQIDVGAIGLLLMDSNMNKTLA
jgi:hypothetical protein